MDNLAWAPSSSAGSPGAVNVPARTSAQGRAIGLVASSHRVEIADSSRYETLRTQWQALSDATAEPNVFLDPAVVSALAETTQSDVFVALAWEDLPTPQPPALVGVWAMASAHAALGLPIKILACPFNRLTFLGTPVIKAGHHVGALRAMFEAIEAHAKLPNVICASDVNADGAFHSALETLAREGSIRRVTLSRRTRAKLAVTPGDGGYLNRSLSSSRRAELRRRRRKLGALGELRHVVHRSPDAVVKAFDAFTELERRGWKGQRVQGGLAIALDRRFERFARSLVRRLAEHGNARVDTLTLDGHPVSMNIHLRSGIAGYGWKMTYDESFKSFSPGALLLETLTNALIQEGQLSFVDGCNRQETSLVALFWRERLDVVDIVIQASPGKSLTFSLVATAELSKRRLSDWIKRYAIDRRHMWPFQRIGQFRRPKSQ